MDTCCGDDQLLLQASLQACRMSKTSGLPFASCVFGGPTCKHLPHGSPRVAKILHFLEEGLGSVVRLLACILALERTPLVFDLKVGLQQRPQLASPLELQGGVPDLLCADACPKLAHLARG